MLLWSWDFPGKITGVGCHFLLQGIFPTWRLNTGFLNLLYWQADYSPQGHLESPWKHSTGCKNGRVVQHHWQWYRTRIPMQICKWYVWLLLLLSHFSRVRLCATPIDSSPPGSPVPRILQARTLEWVAISFSNAWKCKVKGKSLSLIRLLATPWTAAYRVPPSIGFSRQEYWSGCHCLLCRLAWPTAYRSKGLLGHLGGSQINNCLYTHPQKPGVWHHNLFLHERINPFILKYKLCVITE